MKIVLKVLAAIGAALLLVRGLQVLIDCAYEKYGKRYVVSD